MKTLTKLLTKHRFILSPRPLKQLSDCVVDVLWNAVEKTLHVQIMETPQLDVYEWMQYIRRQQAEIQKGPFVDLNKDAITLQFLDEQGREMANLRFKNISLLDHSCYLSYELPEEGSQALVHWLALGYQEVEVIRKEKKDDKPSAANAIVDEEWQTTPT